MNRNNGCSTFFCRVSCLLILFFFSSIPFQIRVVSCQEADVSSVEETKISEIEIRTHGLMDLLTDYGFPAYSHSGAEFFAETEPILEQFLEDLKQARESIYLEFYELDEGFVLDSVLDILYEKIADNVDVRILYDTIGSRRFSPRSHKDIQEKGIPIYPFHPISLDGLSEVTFRDHRKIAVIDGQIAYTGGFNLADQYFNVTHPHGRWKDTGVRVTGEAVQSFLDMFVSLWNEVVPEDLLLSLPEHGESVAAEESQGILQPYTDLPGDSYDINRSVLLHMLQNAKERVFISSPYLMIEKEVLDAFEQAAERGIDVRIITPRIPDKVLVYAATKSYYPELMERGVKIFEFVPGFIHSKVWLMDNDVACVGSVNLDFLSFYNNQEVSLVMYGMDAIGNIIQDFESLFSISECMN